MVTHARKNLDVDIINESFDDRLLGKGITENEFDIIIMGDVLEHFTNSTESMILVHKIVKT